MITEEALWALVEKWRESAVSARSASPGPYLSSNPETAYGQAMNGAAEDLSDLILDSEDEQSA